MPLTVALLAQAIGFAFSAGALILLALSIIPASRPVAGQLWPVLASEAAILAAGVLPWFLPQMGLLAILVLFAVRVGFESGSVHGVTTGRSFRASHALLLGGVSIAGWFSGTAGFIVLAVLLACLAGCAVMLSDKRTLVGSLARFTIFPLLPLAAFSHAAAIPAMAPIMVLAFFLVEVFDSFSLLGGKLFGRTPLVPRLSPRKTWEGLATGTGALLIAILSLVGWLGLDLLPMLVAGLAVIISAIAGDLLGSLAKRQAGVKDYPAVMTVQGGVLDIADSWLVAGPCLVALASLGLT